MSAVRTEFRLGSPEWLAARRSLITGTDIPVLLGLSPWKCEADLADEKLGLVEREPASLRMQVGSALEALIGKAYEQQTGRRVRRQPYLMRHPEIEWAAASLDFRTLREKRLVEAKHTSSRSRFADGLPQDVEAQVQWQLAVSGFPVADVAVLIGDDDLRVFELEADPDLFRDLLRVATDFRRRLTDGGPFERDANRIKRDWPNDSGNTLMADDELSTAVLALMALRERRKALEQDEERIETAVKSRMADATYLEGDAFRVSWKRTKDSTQTDWPSLAQSLLRTLPETEREALVGIHSTVRTGFRPFRVTLKGEPS